MPQPSRNRFWWAVLLIARIALAAVFIFAAVEKMKPPAGMDWSLHSVNLSLLMFSWVVDSYQILPAGMVTLFAQILPPVELILGLWLLTGIALRYSSVISVLLMCMFIVAISSAYERGLAISCGCFGPGVQIGIKRELLQDVLVLFPLSLAVAIGAFVSRRKSGAHAAGSSTPVTS